MSSLPLRGREDGAGKSGRGMREPGIFGTRHRPRISGKYFGTRCGTPQEAAVAAWHWHRVPRLACCRLGACVRKRRAHACASERRHDGIFLAPLRRRPQEVSPAAKATRAAITARVRVRVAICVGGKEGVARQEVPRAALEGIGLAAAPAMAAGHRQGTAPRACGALIAPRQHSRSVMQAENLLRLSPRSP